MDFVKNDKSTVYFATGENPKDKDFKPYSKTILFTEGGTIHFYAKDESTGFSTEIRKEHIRMAQNSWKVLSKAGNKNCIDSKAKTFSEIKAGKKNQKPELLIDLKKETNFNAFAYLPRQDGEKDGTIFDFELQISTNGKKWQTVSSGTFSNIENNPNRRIIKLEKSQKTRFVKLVAISGIRQTNTLAVAEFELFNL